VAGGVGAQSFVVAPESTAGFIAQPPSVTTFAAFGTGRPLWPSDITGLVLWLPADQIQGIASGTSLSNWTDSSASASHATQPSAVSQPVFLTNIQNSLSAISFGTGLAQLMQSPTTLLNTFTLALAGSVYTTRTQAFISASAGAISPKITASTTYFAVNGIALPGSATTVGQFVSLIAIFNPSATTFSVSGTTTFGDAGATTNATLTNIGAVAVSSQTLSGYIGEVVVYNRNLSEIQRSQLESYLRTKWAI